MKEFDHIVIGGGIFGSYSALFLAKQGHQVLLLEKESELFKKASIVNQARLHSGYHYPRSLATAIMANENRERFMKDHEQFINFKFKKYYGIDKYSSYVDGQQFERFCDFVKIPAKRLKSHNHISFNRLESLFETEEFSFDPILIGEYYKDQLSAQKHIKVLTKSMIGTVENTGSNWEVEVEVDDHTTVFRAPSVINATYGNTNHINQLFQLEELKLMYEISEIGLVNSNLVNDIGLTVMDGHFGSVMPFGKSDLLSISSVSYTHHAVSYDQLPKFDCQKDVSNCSPETLGICTTCPSRPQSNVPKMIAQMREYYEKDVKFDHIHSLFTVKTKLMANYIDDGRPTEISVLSDKPLFHCLFSGKINSIYEIEKLF